MAEAMATPGLVPQTERDFVKALPRILIVDDSPSIRFALRRDLEKMGSIVTEATDGYEALDIIHSQSFDLIITDVEMPRIDGFTLCERIKNHHSRRSIPVIILSSKEQEEDIERGFQVGAAGYVPKSNAKFELRDRIQEVLDRSSLLRGRTILVVDDSSATRVLIERALTKAGFHVISADNGQRALELLDRYTPDLILSDLHMPELDGSGLCKIVHAERDLREIPFIVMSSVGDRATMRRLLQYGACAYLVKPFNINQLVVTTERFLSDHFRRLIAERERLDSERKTMIGSIMSLVLALEARDQYTRGHSDSVASILVDMAQQMGSDEELIERAGTAGKLHDLGKIGIRDEILLKSGPLSEEEFRIIRLHPRIGAEILSPIPSLVDIIPAITSHHERIDGKGYPEGLRGDQIPFLARMIAVADTYDALTSDRPYRNGFAHDEALEMIERVKGTQLCPECVEIFFSSIESKMKI